MGDFLINFPWENFKKLKTFRMVNTDIGDGFKEFSAGRSALLR
jgi:hypothetical protein